MASMPAGLTLLERAVGFALGCADEVTPGRLANPTPCAAWDLGALLSHAADSALVLRQAISVGCVPRAVGPAAEPGEGGLGRCPDAAAAFRAETALLLGACAFGGAGQQVAVGGAGQQVAVGGAGQQVGGAGQQVAVGDRYLAAILVAATGAVELAVHGWDIAAACGRVRPIPPELAGDLFEVAFLVVTDATRAGLFGPPVRVGSHARSGDKLLAMLGRTPPG